MKGSVPPSPGDKARHLMFQPRRSSRSGTPRWFPSGGEQSVQADASAGVPTQALPGELAETTGDSDEPGVPADDGVSPDQLPEADGAYSDGAYTDGAYGDAAYTEAGYGGVYEQVGWEPDLGSHAEATVAEVHADRAPADRAPADRAPADGAPADGAPADGAVASLTGEMPVQTSDDISSSSRPAPADLAVVLAAQAEAVEGLGRRVEELARLRRHDADLVDRLHAENSRLRQGELTEALAPLLRGLIRIHDQMTSLGGEDTNSVAGILKSQLLQVLDLTVDVRPFDVQPGTPFDPACHVGVRGVHTDDPELDRTTVRTVKSGFIRGDFAVVRPAETEVYRAD